MFAPRTPARALLRNLRPAARVAAPPARVARSYATTSTRTKPPTASPPGGADGGMGQTLFLLAATMAIGGVIISQRGKVTNEAAVAKARATASDGVGRDRKRVEKPAEEEPKTADVPAIVTKKEEEAEQSTKDASPANQGAFNEETGEINWDCPCLGGMADGPCGEDFKAAFSCFVYSEAEPKGVDCVEKFKGMQDCFRLHPEVYGEEIDDDEQASGPGAEQGGEEIGAVDAPSTTAEPVSTDSEAVKSDEASEKSA